MISNISVLCRHTEINIMSSWCCRGKWGMAMQDSLSPLLYFIVLWFVVVVVVVVRHTRKILPIVHAAAGARPCPSNGIWRICDFDFWHDKSI